MSLALLLEDGLAVTTDLPGKVVPSFVQLLIDLNRLTHYRKDEAQDDLGATGACDVDIHHDCSEFLKDGVFLVHQAQ